MASSLSVAIGTISNKYNYQLGRSADQEEVNALASALEDFFVDGAKKGDQEHDLVTTGMRLAACS